MLKVNLPRVFSDLVVGELARLRHVSALDPSLVDLPLDVEIGAGPLRVDSVELLALAGAASELFHLHENCVEEYLLRYRTILNWCEIAQVSLDRRSENITFRTSGSTGKPKRCLHKSADLSEEAAAHASRLQGCRRVLSMVPAHHIYGFIWTEMLPALLEIPVIDIRKWSPARTVANLTTGDLLVGVPASWKALNEAVVEFPAGIHGVSAGALCPEHLFESLTAGGLAFQDVYGASETAGIGVKTAPYRPFKLLPYWTTPSGEARENTLVRGHGNAKKIMEAPDHLTWCDDTTFQVGRRQDGAIQIAGFNVFPQRVEEVIREYPPVRECAVRLSSSQATEALKAFVVWHPDAQPQERSEAALRTWLETRVAPREQPRSFTFGEQLPRNDMHKNADWEGAP